MVSAEGGQKFTCEILIACIGKKKDSLFVSRSPVSLIGLLYRPNFNALLTIVFIAARPFVVFFLLLRSQQGYNCLFEPVAKENCENSKLAYSSRKKVMQKYFRKHILHLIW